MRVTERQAVYDFFADLLVKRAADVADFTHAPLGPRLVANCLGDLPGIFASSFPGYLGAGLAGVVLRRIVGQKD